MKPKSKAPLRLKQLLIFQNGKEIKNKLKIQNTISINNRESSLNQYYSLLSLLHKKLYHKYNCKPQHYISKQLNNLIKGAKTHQVSIFKDQMILDFTAEFLRRSYIMVEIKERLKKFPAFYLKYLLFFCKPVFYSNKINKAIHKYYERKAEIYYLDHYCEATQQKGADSIGKSKIFNTTINEEINLKSITTSNIFQTNFEYYTNNNHRRKRFIDSMCEISLIYKNYNKTIINTDNNFINESWSPYLNRINIPSTIDCTGDIFNSPRETIFIPANGSWSRPKHMKLQAISEKLEQKTQQKLFKLKASEMKNQPSFKNIVSKNTTPMNIEKKSHPNILIDFSNNHKSYNKYALPHTKSTGDIMKVSFVIYTNQNESGRNKLKQKNQQTEFAISTPTMNNVNINIHNKVNLSPKYLNYNIRKQISNLKLITSEKLYSPGKSISRNKIEYNPNCIPFINNKHKEPSKIIIIMMFINE